MLPDAPERSEKESAQLDLSGILSGDLDKSVSRREACERERDCRVGSQGTRGRGESDSDRSPAHSWAGATVSLLPSRTRILLSTPLSFTVKYASHRTTPPWCCSDKSPRIHGGQRGRRFGMGGYQTPSYPGQEAHKLSRPQGSALGLLHLLRQKGPRTGRRGSVNTPDFPPQRAQQGFKVHPSALWGTRPAWTMAGIPKQCESHRRMPCTLGFPKQGASQKKRGFPL